MAELTGKWKMEMEREKAYYNMVFLREKRKLEIVGNISN